MAIEEVILIDGIFFLSYVELHYWNFSFEYFVLLLYIVDTFLIVIYYF